MERSLYKNQIFISFFHLFQDAEAKKNRHFYNLDNDSYNSKDFNDNSEIEIKIEPFECKKETINLVINLQGEITRKKDTFVSIGNLNKYDCSSIFPNEDYKFSIKLKNTNISTNKKHKISTEKKITGLELKKIDKISLFNIGENLICEIFQKKELNNYHIQNYNEKINDNMEDSSKFIELLKETEKVISVIELIFKYILHILLCEPKDSFSI